MLGRGHSTCKGPGVGRARLECERGQRVGGRRKMPWNAGVEAFARFLLKQSPITSQKQVLLLPPLCRRETEALP